jgi:hypothetical protein
MSSDVTACPSNMSSDILGVNMSSDVIKNCDFFLAR